LNRQDAKIAKNNGNRNSKALALLLQETAAVFLGDLGVLAVQNYVVLSWRLSRGCRAPGKAL
jgi:hypothetical protein